MKLTLDGIILEFEVLEYTKTTEENRDYEWCRTRLHVQSNHINYFEDSRLILCSELQMLQRHLKLLLDGKLRRSEHIFLTEPVLEFRLRPATDDTTTLDLYWIINLRDDSGTVTANNLQLLLDSEDTKKFYRYLLDVMRQ